MEWMILPLRRYAQFSGRAQRKEYWMFFLFTIVTSLVLSIVDSVLGFGGSTTSYATESANGFAAGAYSRGGVLSSIWSLVLLVPSIAVAVRRLHDVDRTGWWILAPFAPIAIGTVLIMSGTFVATGGQSTGGMGSVLIAGLLTFIIGFIVSIVLLVWLCTDGTRGANRFGPDPKGHVADLHETFS